MAQTVIQGDGFFTYFAQQAVSDRNILWIGLGRPTAWDGGVKPTPDNDVGLVDPILYQKADTAAMVRAVTIDDDYDYTWYSSSQTYYFKRITSDEAIAGNDRWIYISTTFLPGVLSLPEFTYRAVGYFHNLTPATGHENDTSLLPANVTNVGNTTYSYMNATAPVSQFKFTMKMNLVAMGGLITVENTMETIFDISYTKGIMQINNLGQVTKAIVMGQEQNEKTPGDITKTIKYTIK